jgi:hypothetical protein
MQVLITCWQRRFDTLEWDEVSCSLTSLSHICSLVGDTPRVELEIGDEEITITSVSGDDIAYYRVEVVCNDCDREEVIERMSEAASPREVVR